MTPHRTRRRARRRTRRCIGGFTLIEVLIAVAVLAIALGASLDALNVFSDTQVRLHERYLGHLTAWNVMTDHYNEQRAAAEGGAASLTTEGSEDQGGRTWQWSLQRKERRESAAEDDADSPSRRLAIVVVDVYSPGASRGRGAAPSATLQAIFGQ